MPKAASLNRTTKTEELVALRISNGGVDSATLPTRLKLLAWGKNETVKGPVVVGPETVASLAANQKAAGFDRIALDFNHQTVPGSETFQKDPVEVAAYGTPVVVPDDGLYLDNIQWTPAGKEFAANYHDLSPTVRRDANGEVNFIHSAALCRQGAVNDLHFFTVFQVPLTTLTPTPMADPTSSNSAVDYKALLTSILQKLGVTVADGASDADIAQAVDQYKAPAKPAAAAAAGPDDEVTAMSARLVKLEAADTQRQRDALVALATSQGKVVPFAADDLNQLSPILLKALLDKTPATVPLTQITPVAKPGQAASGGVVALSAEDKEVCRVMNISEADFIKHNPEAAPARAVV